MTLAGKWLDPAETEAFSTPFMVLYGVHVAPVKPMPAGLNTPSLAESWQKSKDHRARELDSKKREAMLHQIQKTLADQVTTIPIYDLAFIWGRGPRVAEGGARLIPGFSYSAPFEDLRPK